MVSKDPFGPASRWRILPVPMLAVAFLALVISMGLVSPAGTRLSLEDLRSQVVSDFYRLQHAVEAYTKDNGAFPQAAFDLSEGYDGGLSNKTFVPLKHLDTWKGPYLQPVLARPTDASFWSLAEPCHMNDRDADGEADELWGRLHRGYGEIDAASAAWLDEVLDDAVPDRGALRVTPTWIWFQLQEL